MVYWKHLVIFQGLGIDLYLEPMMYVIVRSQRYVCK